MFRASDRIVSFVISINDSSDIPQLFSLYAYSCKEYGPFYQRKADERCCHTVFPTGNTNKTTSNPLMAGKPGISAKHGRHKSKQCCGMSMN